MELVSEVISIIFKEQNNNYNEKKD